jgi:NAD(P)-dependent dehydrogenase (short-subunit alcohol dehydrogenase family)
VETADGLEHVFAVNVLAPYLLTALITRPARLVYLSSGMHRGGRGELDDPQWAARRWNGAQAYSDSKLFDVLLAFGVARRWPGVLSNSLEPGWVATKMGGSGGPLPGRLARLLRQAHRHAAAGALSRHGPSGMAALTSAAATVRAALSALGSRSIHALIPAPS